MLTTEYTPVQQLGNGVIVAFNFNFKILAATDLVVSKVNASGVSSGTLVLGSDYTVVFDPVAENGTVTYTVPPVNGGYSLIQRVSNDQQQTRLPREGLMPATTVETMIDKVALRLQEIEYAVTNIVFTNQPLVVDIDTVLLARALASPANPFIGVFLTSRTIQIYLGDPTLGVNSNGWAPIGGF